MGSILRVSNIDVSYGPVGALYDASIEVPDGDVVAIIGATGAGKSTLMKAVMGLAHVGKGTIVFEGTHHLEKMVTDRIVKLGIGYVPEGRRIFPQMTVVENLEMGAYSRKATKPELKRDMDECFEMFSRLYERRGQMAGTLSGGEQQMLAMARGLMCKPKLLLLDEPSMGLAPVVVEEMFRAIERINKTMKMPILLVEQNAYMALGISKYCYVLENGRVALSGSQQEMQNSDEVRKRYLGG